MKLTERYTVFIRNDQMLYGSCTRHYILGYIVLQRWVELKTAILANDILTILLANKETFPIELPSSSAGRSNMYPNILSTKGHSNRTRLHETWFRKYRRGHRRLHIKNGGYFYNNEKQKMAVWTILTSDALGILIFLLIVGLRSVTARMSFHFDCSLKIKK